MANKLSNYLRTYRKRACLTQDEVAYLMGCKKGAKVSRYEHSTRLPNIESLLAYEVIFQAPFRELYAGAYLQIEKNTARRARTLMRRLEASDGEAICPGKMEVLRRISEPGETDSEEITTTTEV